ncbi:MFS transporter [Helicobacter muridarum]|uniref:MFS transporter n=1 Tax=Helicobacter muridarum TaxID=216 RepID=A0A099TZ76_9HELI|nr:MFS transporter [Helicobacter muridarum]TLD99916.1 MFS transporter [Helicobacter muridarum]STQ86827.1 multidrug-efflux protein [Helicobacter muridarum]
MNCILLLILLAVFVVPSSISGTAIALPYIAQSLGSESLLLQWVVNSFNLCFACFTLIWGTLSDKLGAKNCLITGVGIYLLGSILSFLAPSLFWLDIGRACAGIGGASIFACGSAILIRDFEDEKRIKTFAFFGTTAGLGITLGPTISGFLIDIFAWRAIFAFHFLTLLCVLLLSPVLPQDSQKQRTSFDTLGAILFIAFMSSFMFFITQIHAFKEPQTLGILAFCVLSGIAFLIRERNLHYKNIAPNPTSNLSIPQPLLDFEVLKNTQFLGFSLVTVIAGFSFVVLLTYFPTFLSISFGLSASISGLFMLSLTTPMLFCPILAGRTLNKGVNSKSLAIAMSLMMSLGIFVLLLILHTLSGAMLQIITLLMLFIIGCGMGLHAGAIDGLALGSIESTKSGLGAGVLNSLRLGSEAVGVSLYGALMVVFITASLSHSVDSVDNGDSLYPLVESIASGNLGLIENSQILANASSIYLQSFSYTLGILGALSFALTLGVWRLLKRRQEAV